ncbi:Protein FAR1-RELATED SEQUENCE 5 [Glycine max]|nr:Protein FAR1-RELATED SEQUENCE 5 [Glycine max]
MTKSMVKPKNILLTLKEHNANSCTTIKQTYNARNAYCSSIKGANTEMQHLIKLLEHDQYIHWHRLKDEVVVRDLFWCHPDAVKLCNACHLVFCIDNTYKTNRYRLPLLDFVGVTPTAMTFSAGFAYLEAERINNIVWALERFRGLFLRNGRLPIVIVTNRDLTLMNAVKTVFPECTNLLCRFHIDKNVKAKCKSLIGQKNAWDYVMDNWGTLVDYPSEHQFAESLQKFQIACSPWRCSLTMLTTHGLSPTRKNLLQHGRIRVESAQWALKRVLQNSLGDLCSVWDAMNNMITLQHVEIKASFETSMHVVGHVFKKTLYKRLLGMVSMDALNEIAFGVDRLRYLGNNPSSCGCVMRSTHMALPKSSSGIPKGHPEESFFRKLSGRTTSSGSFGSSEISLHGSSRNSHRNESALSSFFPASSTLRFHYPRLNATTILNIKSNGELGRPTSKAKRV